MALWSCSVVEGGNGPADCCARRVSSVVVLAQSRPQPGVRLPIDAARSADVPRQRRQAAEAEGVAQRRAGGRRPQLRRRQRDRRSRRPATSISKSISRGEYGAVDGLPRILRLLDKHQVPASFFIPAVSHLLHPQMIPTILRQRPPRDRRPRLDPRASAVGERRSRRAGHAQSRHRDADQGDRQEAGRLPRAVVAVQPRGR